MPMQSKKAKDKAAKTAVRAILPPSDANEVLALSYLVANRMVEDTAS